MHKTGTALTAFATLAAASAAADFGMQFNELDRNGDGAVGLRELAAAEFFARNDFDGNGVIQADELGNQWLFQRWDLDGDSDLSRAEFYRGMLAYADTDGDGRLGPVEFQRTQTDWSFGEPIESPGGTGISTVD